MTEVERAALALLAHLRWVGWVSAEDELVTALRAATSDAQRWRIGPMWTETAVNES